MKILTEKSNKMDIFYKESIILKKINIGENILKTLKLKILLLLISLGGFILLGCSTKNEIYFKDQTSLENLTTEAYKYPITPENKEEWLKFKTLKEKMNACQIPKEIVEEMDTEALVETVLNYPMFPSIYFFDNPEYAIDIYMDFNGLCELFKRDNAGQILLNIYTKIAIKEAANDRDLISTLLKLEMLLARKEIWSTMDEIDLHKLVQETNLKYIQKKEIKSLSAFIISSFYRCLDLNAVKNYITTKDKHLDINDMDAVTLFNILADSI